MGWGAVFMLSSVPFSILVGTVLGALAGMGVGGGSLLMLWLTGIIGMAYPDARAINLLFFLPSALVSTLFRWKQGSINIQETFPAIIAGSLCAIVGTWLSGRIQLELLKKLFGCLLLVTGTKEILYRPRKAR